MQVSLLLLNTPIIIYFLLYIRNVAIASGISSSKFDSNCIKPDYRYYPRLAVARGDQSQPFVSTKKAKGVEGQHAEAILLQAYSTQSRKIKIFSISYSPCSSCTDDILHKMDAKPKPTIQFLTVHGQPGTKARKDAAGSLERLKKAGFPLAAWDVTNFAQYLLEEAPTPVDRHKLKASLETNVNTFYERYCATIDIINDIKISHHRSTFNLIYECGMIIVYSCCLIFALFVKIIALLLSLPYSLPYSTSKQQNTMTYLTMNTDTL